MNEFKEWGKWVRDNPDRLSARSGWLMPVPCGHAGYTMTDERGCQIDAALSMLAQYSSISAHVFVMFYVHRLTLDTIANDYLTKLIYQDKRRKANRHDVKHRLLVAEGYIAGCLDFVTKKC